MRVIVIPDIHLKGWLFRGAATILDAGLADRSVCLMDIPDDFGMTMNTDLYRKTFDIAIEFATNYPDTLWCWGNHELSYVWGHIVSGYSPYAEKTVLSKLEELKSNLRSPSDIAFVHRIDNTIFAHGGLTEAFVAKLDLSPQTDIDDVIQNVNSASERVLWNDTSPLWFRPQSESQNAFRKETFTHVVGHTPVELIHKNNGFISVDTFSTFRNGAQIGEAKMIVIDTISGEYEKIEVKRPM